MAPPPAHNASCEPVCRLPLRSAHRFKLTITRRLPLCRAGGGEKRQHDNIDTLTIEQNRVGGLQVNRQTYSVSTLRLPSVELQPPVVSFIPTSFSHKWPRSPTTLHLNQIGLLKMFFFFIPLSKIPNERYPWRHARMCSNGHKSLRVFPVFRSRW